MFAQYIFNFDIEIFFNIDGMAHFMISTKLKNSFFEKKKHPDFRVFKFYVGRCYKAQQKTAVFQWTFIHKQHLFSWYNFVYH